MDDIRALRTVSLSVNGREVSVEVEARTSLADCLRDQLRLTGTHLGCEHGVCGACTIELDGQIVRSCLTLASTCDGASVCSIEGFADNETMRIVRQAFHEAHGLQCGFCTPGMLITVRDVILRKPYLDRDQIRVELAGNLCRCTGYAGIVRAVELSIERLRSAQKPMQDETPR